MSDGDHISPWMPEQDQLRLAALGKLAEECNELAGRAVRCIIQGINETDPDSGRTNHSELEREIADVQACIIIATALLKAVPNEGRRNTKVGGFLRWHDLIRSASQPDRGMDNG